MQKRSHHLRNIRIQFQVWGEGGRVLTKRQAENGLRLAALADNVVDTPIVTIKNDGSRARRSNENLDRDDSGSLSNTVGRTTKSTSDVSTVAIGVLVGTTDGVVTV